MKLKHFAVFNNLKGSLDWEKLRNDSNEAAYFLPNTKDEYLRMPINEYYSSLAKIIVNEIDNIDIKDIFSIGSGKAQIEYLIKKNSDFNVIVSDYNDSVLRLKQFGIFNDAVVFNVLKDKLPMNENYVIIFPRIDTEFTDKQLTDIFEKCWQIGIKYIFFIPAQLLNYHIFISEIKTIIISLIRREKRVFCGYSRSKSEFIKLWNKYYNLEKEFNVGHGGIFLLKIIDASLKNIKKL